MTEEEFSRIKPGNILIMNMDYLSKESSFFYVAYFNYNGANRRYAKGYYMNEKMEPHESPNILYNRFVVSSIFNIKFELI